MFSLIIFSSLLLVVSVHGGYPVVDTYPTPPPKYETSPVYPTTPSYPVPKKYPTAPVYPTKPSYSSPPNEYAEKPSYSAPPPPPSPSGYSSNSFGSVASDSSYSPSAAPYSESTDYNSAGTFHAKARTSQNHRVFHRRALQPIRRFQKKQ
uniref:Extensin-like n=1 Tax=Caenorhabditis tropicalis TaxID=1561998 RepID=A0A1I7T615_9PELO